MYLEKDASAAFLFLLLGLWLREMFAGFFYQTGYVIVIIYIGDVEVGLGTGVGWT